VATIRESLSLDSAGAAAADERRTSKAGVFPKSARTSSVFVETKMADPVERGAEDGAKLATSARTSSVFVEMTVGDAVRRGGDAGIRLAASARTSSVFVGGLAYAAWLARRREAARNIGRR